MAVEGVEWPGASQHRAEFTPRASAAAQCEKIKPSANAGALFV